MAEIVKLYIHVSMIYVRKSINIIKILKSKGKILVGANF